jgi:hypothetical protein
MTKEYFLERARSIHGYKYNYPNLSKKIKYDQYIEIEYMGKIYTQKINKHFLGRSPELNTPKRSTNQFINEAKNIWGDKYDYSLVEYNGANRPVKILYRGIIFEQIPSGHLNKKAPEAKINNKEFFILLSRDKYGEDYDYSLVDYVDGDTKVKIIHKKTGNIYEQRPSDHLKARPENIKLAVRKTNEQFIKEANQVHDFKYDYSKSFYVKNQVKVTIICPVHGEFTQRPLSHLQGNGCAVCSESRGEKEIAKFLKENNINFERQKKFSDCKNIFELPFDFYIQSLRTFIEFDSKQHFEPIKHFGGLENFNRLQENDKIKTNYCEDNYINLIRIRYDQIDQIHQILWSHLKERIKKRY